MRYIRLALAYVLCFCAGVAYGCTGADNITAINPAQISFDEYAYLRYAQPIKVLSVDAPPLSDYYEKGNNYKGIGADILCYISELTGLQFEYIISDDNFAEKIAATQNGKADMFMPLSYTQARAKKGLFTRPFYNSFYTLLASSKNHIVINDLNQLKDYTVGVVGSVSMEPLLQELLPNSHIKSYGLSEGADGMFAALRRGEIDLALYNKDLYTEKRFRLELFDIESIYTLGNYPRKYRFYFHDTPENRYLVRIFNRILDTIDIQYSVQQHKYGEEQLIERYIKQRSQRKIMRIGSILIGLLAVIFAIALFKHMRLIKKLESSNSQILSQQRELERLSLTDTLTGLANRRMFDQTIIKEHARLERNPSPLSLIMLDIDNFKNINDTFGHTTGDEYLCAVAGAICQVVKRKTDLIARYGGEEFICILPDTNLIAAQKVAERIRKAVIDLNLSNPGVDSQVLTVSLGVACLERFDYPIKSFIQAVDAQLYMAKRSGKNRYSGIQL